MFETLKQIDTTWFLAINNGLQNSFMDVVCPYLREPKFWIPVYVLVAWLSYKKFGTKALWVMLAAGVLVLISDQFSANLIKKSVMRLRPCNEPTLKDQVHLLVHCGQGYSFMSAHATNHFAIAVYFSLLFRAYWRWLLPVALLWAASIAFSQVYVGVHYPLDVLCGALTGSVFGYIASKLVKQKLALQ